MQLGFKHTLLTRYLSAYLNCNSNNAYKMLQTGSCHVASTSYSLCEWMVNPSQPAQLKDDFLLLSKQLNLVLVCASFRISFLLTERTFWRQQPWERCRKHVPWGEKLPQASESLFTTSCACYFHQNRALSFSSALFLRLIVLTCSSLLFF